MNRFDSVKSYLYDHFEDFHPPIENTEYAVGTVLHTADSSKWTNATITFIDLSKKHGPYRVLTDIGNEIHVGLNDLQAMYLPPKLQRVHKSELPLPRYYDVSQLGNNFLTYKEVADRINKMWIQYMCMKGYEVTDDALGWECIHPAEEQAWRVICQLAESAFPDVDIEEVLAYVENP